MPRDGRVTKERILDAAQSEVLHKGFAATSVDDIQAAAGISRGTFFYHFPSKDDLAKALIARYAQADHALVEGYMERAERLASDPLQQALVFVALHEEMLEELPTEQVGCLFASFSYEAGLFDDETHELITGAIDHWREAFGGKLAEAMERHPPLLRDVDPYLLADLGYGVLQGAFILRRSMDDPHLMARHAREFRRYLELLFGVAETARADGEGADGVAVAEEAGASSR